MDLEIELKLLATPSARQDILFWLAQSALNYSVLPSKQLRNDYFETPQRSLRKHDIGLRIRGHNNEFEQTVKTKGRVVAGMHQRPEYNVALASPELQLHLFAPEIWPKSIDVAALKRELYLMFSTDFLRHTYMITMASGAQIELVFDQGTITANGNSADICEIELELKSGEPSQLFELAQQLVDVTPLRFGLHSKAARGYRLADDLPEPEYTPPVQFGSLPDKPLVENAVLALEQALDVWQQGEAAFYQSQSIDDWRTMRAGMSLVQGSLALYQTIFDAWATDEANAVVTPSAVSAQQDTLKALLIQHKETDLVLAVKHMGSEQFRLSNQIPHHDVVSLQLIELTETSKVLTRLNAVLSNPQSMRIQLALGALCIDMARGRETQREATSIAAQPITANASMTKDTSLQQFVAKTLQADDLALPKGRNKMAASEVIWGSVNVQGAFKSESDPWRVLRHEDTSSVQEALVYLVKEQYLTLVPNVKSALLGWCTNNESI